MGFDIWDMFCEILVALDANFEVLGVVLVETPDVTILGVVDFMVTAITLIETKETIVVNGFIMLLLGLDLLVLLEDRVSVKYHWNCAAAQESLEIPAARCPYEHQHLQRAEH